MQTISLVSERGHIWETGNVKSSLLLFDKIYIPPCQNMSQAEEVRLSNLKGEVFNTSTSNGDILYLANEGVVVENPVADSEVVTDAYRRMEDFINTLGKKVTPKIRGRILGCYLERIGASQISKSDSDEVAIPSSSIMNGLSQYMPLNSFKQSEVLTLVVEQFPVISEQVPYEEILEFRLQNKNPYKQMMQWVRKMSRSDVQASELKDEIEQIIVDYQLIIQSNELKFKPSKFELMLGTCSAIRDVATLRFGAAQKTLAEIRKGKADLLTSELEHPGRPLSYLINLNDKFGS